MANKNTIEFELSDEYLEILAQVNGYQPTVIRKIPNKDTKELEDKEVDNPQTKVQFIEDILIARLNAQVAEYHHMKEQSALNTRISVQMKDMKGIIKTKKK